MVHIKHSISIITGSFGSGKSEYSINTALKKANKLNNVVLVDLDLVNAYFRSREVRSFLKKHKIKTVVPVEKVYYSDLPIAGPGIKGLILSDQHNLIIDVGGDDMGARALGFYREELLNKQYNMLMVINPLRPFTDNVQKIIEMKESIERTSGLFITSIISNPNAGARTSINQVLDQHQLVVAAAQKMNLPIQELIVHQDLLNSNPGLQAQLDIPVTSINIYLMPQWLWKQQKEEMTWQQ